MIGVRFLAAFSLFSGWPEVYWEERLLGDDAGELVIYNLTKLVGRCICKRSHLWRWLWRCNGTFWTPYQFNVFGKGPWKRMISFGHYPNYLPTPKFGQVGPFFFKAVRHCLIETKWEVSRVTLKWSFLRTTYKPVQRPQRSKHCHFWRNWLFLLIKIQLAKKGQNFGKAPPPILFFRDPSLSHNLHANHVIEGSKTFTGKARISRNIFSESWYFRFRKVKLAGCCIPRNGTPPCSCIGVASQAVAATAGKFN